MSLMDVVRPSINPAEVPGKVQSRTTRGRAEMRRDASKRRLCQWYERGDSYGYLDPKGFLARQSSAQNPSGAARPGHRIRNTYNYIRPIVQGKVSAASQRVPSYEILPSNTDPQNIAAARIAEQVALYGYDKWRIKAATVKACTLAIGGGGDAFAFPYFDPNVGPYTTNALTGEVVGQGEIKIQILSGNEVYWEPGVDFVDSPWYAVELARPIYEVKEIPGFFGKTLVPDANTSDLPTEKSANNELVLVTEYYERPCPDYPNGRRIVMANNRVIVDNRRIDPQAESNFEDYPLKDAQGRAIDEPILHRLQWTPSATGECDLGLTWQLIDFQRTMQDCMNKLMEWKNRCVAGETLVSTRDGLRTAESLSGKEIETLCGDGEFRKVQWSAQGVDRLWKIAFEDGEVVYATKNHRWITRRNGADHEVTTPMLEGLSVPRRSVSAHQETRDVEDWWHGVRHGLMWGDGTVEHHQRKDREYSYGVIRQYATDENLSLVERFFPGSCTERRTYGGTPWVAARDVDPALKSLPAFDSGCDYLRGWLAGAIASDGAVARHTIKITQSSREELEAVATIARSVGIRVVSLKHAAKGNWHLSLAKHSFVNAEHGVDTNLILKPSHQDNLAAPTKYRRDSLARVVSVEPTERVEETYCCTEPVTSTWVLGSGLVTGNCLNPRKMAPRGSNFKPAVDDPGGIDYYDVVNGGVIKPEWENVPQGFAQPLIDIFQLTQNGMQYVGFDNQLAADANVAARTVTAVIEQTEAKWSAFLGGLADWHARVMRHSLVLVRNHYSEERVIAIRGRFGPDAIHNFTGAQLMDQVDVRVLPGSLDFMTKDKLVERVFAYADRQWITGQQAMLAIDAGTSDVLVQSMELDIARIDRIIRKIRDGSVMDMPTRQETETDPNTGMTRPVEVPSWMPLDHVDNLKVWHERLSDWMKTDDYDTLPPEKQAPAKWIMQGIEQLQAQQAQRAIEQQNAQAEQAGLKNAARPQQAKPMPDQPKPGAGTPELQTT